MGHLSMAVLQLELENCDNLNIIEKEINSVMRRFPWTQMVVLPELCTYGPDPRNAVCLPGEVENFYRELASQHGIWLIPGSLFEKDGEHTYNTTSVIDPSGEVIARYRKHYPFLPYEKGIDAGEGFVVFDVPDLGRVGVIICYDMWIPEMVRTLTWMGAEAIICPSLTNTIDREIEIAVTQGNAAQHQVYFLNNNSAGTMGVGRTVLAGPDGKIIHQAGTAREIITVQLDFDLVRRCRERGSFGLIQINKSFRDLPTDWPPYRNAMQDTGAFEELGPLKVPERE